MTTLSTTAEAQLHMVNLEKQKAATLPIGADRLSLCHQLIATNLKIQPPLHLKKGVAIRSEMELRVFGLPNGKELVHIHASEAAYKGIFGDPYKSPLIQPKDLAAISIIIGEGDLIPIDATQPLISNVSLYILSRGDPSIALIIKRVLFQQHFPIYIIPENLYAISQVFNVSPPIKAVMAPPKEWFILSGCDRAIEIFYARSIPPTTKLFTLFYAFFPYIREKMIANFDYCIEANLAETHSIAPTTIESIPELGWGKKGMLAVGVALLFYGYTRDAKIASQITKRLAAAAAESGYNAMPESDIQTTISEAGLVHDKVHGIIDEVLGWIIAIDKDYEHDRLIEEDALMPIEVLKNSGTMAHWTIQVLVQARLIYRSHKNQSIRMALAVLPIFQNYLPNLVKEWGSEVEAVRKIARKLRVCHYIGLGQTMPEDFQIAKMAKLCFMGVLYHSNCLSTDVEKAEFKNYIYSSIESHITDTAMRQTIRNVVNTIPTNDVIMLARIVSGLPVRRAEQIMAMHTAEVSNQVYEIINLMFETKEPGFESVGEWYTAIKHMKINQQLLKTLGEARIIVERVIETERKKADNEADRCAEQEERLAKKKALNEWYDKLMAASSGTVSLKDQISPAISSEMKGLVERITEVYRKLLEVAMKGVAPVTPGLIPEMNIELEDPANATRGVIRPIGESRLDLPSGSNLNNTGNDEDEVIIT